MYSTAPANRAIVIGALGAVTEWLIKGLKDLEIRGRVETLRTAALLRTARILRRVMETCCHSNSSERSSANADVKNSQGVNNNNNNNQQKKGTCKILTLRGNWKNYGTCK